VEVAPPRVNMLARRAPKDGDDEKEEEEGVLLAWTRTLRVVVWGVWRD